MLSAEPRRYVGLVMLGRLLDFLLAEILLLLLLPVLALGFLIKKLIVTKRRWMGAPTRPERPVPAPVRRLVFARAIEAYEDLIDVTAQGANHRTRRGIARVRQA
jgi:hypothetical protein